MTDNYYIRVRGQVKGPFSVEQIRSQIRRKRIGRHHEVSLDCSTWQQAGDVPDLFEPVVASRANSDATTQQSESEEYSARDAGKPNGNPAAGTATQGADLDWYYAKGGNKLGPVSASDIQMWLASGRLAATDLVWHETFDNWIPAGELPQFALAIGNSPTADSEVRFKKATFWEAFWGTSKGAKLPNNAIYKFPNLSRYLAVAEATLRFLFAVSLILYFVAVVMQFAAALRLDEPAIAIGSLFAIPVGVFSLWLAFISGMAFLELIRVWVKIEDNTSRAVGTGE